MQNVARINEVPEIPFQYPASACSYASTSGKSTYIATSPRAPSHNNDHKRKRTSTKRYNGGNGGNGGNGSKDPNLLASISSLFEDGLPFKLPSLPPADLHAQTIIPVAAGTLAFTAFLSLSTLLQLKVFKISTGSTPPIPTLLGIGSVATAALVSHVVSIGSFQQVSNRINNGMSPLPSILSISPQRQRSKRNDGNYDHYSYPYPLATMSSKNEFPFSLPSIRLPIDLDLTQTQNLTHALRIATVGLITYKLLGGRFWSIAPSSLTNLGSFARTRFAIPAGTKYANFQQRRQIEALGRKWGCHTCGSRGVLSISRIGSNHKHKVKFHADHMPPNSAVKQMNQKFYRRVLGWNVKQKFYPQCTSCSNLQGGILSEGSRRGAKNLINLGGGENALNHASTFRFRMEHLTGGLVAAATVVGVSSDSNFASDAASEVVGDWDVHGSGGNRKRFLQWQNRAFDFWECVTDAVKGFF